MNHRIFLALGIVVATISWASLSDPPCGPNQVRRSAFLVERCVSKWEVAR